MTSQFDFSNNEWADIASLPVLVGYAVAKAEDSGFFGSLREIRTLTNTVATTAPHGEASALIAAASEIDVRHKVDEYEGHAATVLGDIAVRACEEVSRLLVSRAAAPEAAGYQSWVFDIAERVAEAAKEHGVRVSEPEAALLERLRNALGQA